MTIEAGHKSPAFIVMIFFFGFILVDYQTEFWVKYLVIGDWRLEPVYRTATL